MSDALATTVPAAGERRSPTPAWLRLLRFELVRLRSLRSTYVLLLLALLSSLVPIVSARSLLTLGPGAVDGVSARFVWTSVVSAPSATLAVLVGIFGAMSLGHDFRYGTMPLTAVHLLRRSRLFTGKLLVAAALSCAVSVVVVLLGMAWVCLAYSWSAVGGTDVGAADVGQLLLRLAVVSAGCTAIGFCVVALTSSLQLGIALPLVWSNVVEPVLLLSGVVRGPLGSLLPYRNARNGITGPLSGLSLPGAPTQSAWLSVLLFLLPVAALCLVSWWRFSRTDL